MLWLNQQWKWILLLSSLWIGKNGGAKCQGNVLGKRKKKHILIIMPTLRALLAVKAKSHPSAPEHNFCGALFFWSSLIVSFQAKEKRSGKQFSRLNRRGSSHYTGYGGGNWEMLFTQSQEERAPSNFWHWILVSMCKAEGTPAHNIKVSGILQHPWSRKNITRDPSLVPFPFISFQM